jgi:HEAT repeat protein
MKKGLLLGLLGLLVLLGLGVWLEPTGVALGWLHGEAFYRERPTRYWRKALTSEDPKTQVESYDALKEGGRAATPVLTEMLRDGKPEVRWQAADLLGQMGPAPAGDTAARDALVRALQDDDPHVRAVAASSLSVLGAAGPEAIPVLCDMLTTGERLAALKALVRYGPEAEPAIPRLVKLLTDADSEIRWRAAMTLGKIGPAARGSVSPLVAALKDEDALVREHAAEALGDIGPDAKEAVPALTTALQDADQRVRRDAVRSLGQIGPAARSAAPAIRPLLNDKEERVRRAARTALQQVER